MLEEKTDTPETGGRTIRISAAGQTLEEELKEVLEYRDLILMFVKREFTVKYKQTVLGPLWLVVNPFLTSLVYLFIFSGIARIQTDQIPPILFYLGSNGLWMFFSSTLNANANLFRDNAYLFGKVYFPRLTVPIANVLISALMFLIGLLPFALLYVWYLAHGQVHGSLLALPMLLLILIWLGLLGTGCGILLSSATTKYKDVSILVQFGVQLWMFVTPVVYPLSGVNNSLMQTLILLNPVSQPMELFRLTVLGSGTIVPWSLFLSIAVTTALALTGRKRFSSVERTFIDTI